MQPEDVDSIIKALAAEVEALERAAIRMRVLLKLAWDKKEKKNDD
jgi:hypothetical protein